MPTERTFDWRPNPDPKSANFPLHVPRSLSALPAFKYWNAPYVNGKPLVLDQGQEGACVGHGVTNALLRSPIGLKPIDPGQLARGMYYGSRRIDEWPGEDYDGTSVNAGCKLARELGLILNWDWPTGLDAIIYALCFVGPVVFGLNWLSHMEEVDDQGMIQVWGDFVGGHCVCLDGYRASRPFGKANVPQVRVAQSWGAEWGVGGFAWMTVEQLGTRLADQGEAAVLRRRAA